MEDILKEMRTRINEDLIFVERAESLKKMANISSSKAVDFLTNIKNVLPDNISGYACGEMWYIYYKGEILFAFDKTRAYSGKGTKYNKYVKHGKMIVTLKTQVELQKFINFIVKDNNSYNINVFGSWIDKEQSLYKSVIKWEE